MDGTTDENNALIWLVNTSEIQPYKSAVLGNNYVSFYTIHFTAIVVIIISLISCLIVIVQIVVRSRTEAWDFSDRFPLYLAIADALWGIPHLIDNIILVTTLKYPGPSFGTGLSIIVWFFMGYRGLLYTGLATYMYLKIVRVVPLDLGKGEWKLHALILFLLTLSVAVFYPLGSFGCSGYWFLQDIQTKAGLALGVYICILVTIHALCTTIGYRRIKEIVDAQRKAMLKHSIGKHVTKQHLHSTATECLTTFICIALGLYCPFAVVYSVFTIECFIGVLDPLTPFMMVILANSSGWANALGYFHNNKVKAKRHAASGFLLRD